MPFAGKVALITGAASGIGRAAALAFAQQGVRVAVVDTNERDGHDTVQQIAAAGGTAHFIRADISQEAEVQAMVAQTVAQFGQLDYAFNNAGIAGQGGALHEMSMENFDGVIAVNLRGVFLCLKYEIQHMLQHGGGAIVNTASIAGLVASRGLAHYVASKHGVVGLTKAAALDYAQHNIRVNAIAPGVIVTPLAQQYVGGDPEVLRQQFAAVHPVNRVGEPEEVAQAAVWLCSDAASFMTGTTIPIDGGLTAQ